MLRRGAQTLAAKVHALEAALTKANQQRDDFRRAATLWKGTAELLNDRVELYRDTLKDIAERPVVERNPDGVDQAAHTMQLLAREALAVGEHVATKEAAG